MEEGAHPKPNMGTNSATVIGEVANGQRCRSVNKSGNGQSGRRLMMCALALVCSVLALGTSSR